jgi:phosphate/sulfate permease
MSLAYGGKHCVVWSVSTVISNNSYSYKNSYSTGVSAHALAWILSPLITGCISAALFRAVRFGVLQRSKPLLAMRYCYPLLIALTLLVNTLYILCKIADLRELSDQRVLTVISIAAVSTLLMTTLAVTVGYPAVQRFQTATAQRKAAAAAARTTT